MVGQAWEAQDFLCAGYFVGISVILFSASNTSFVAKLFPNSAHIVELTAIFLIILDLIMTFFGSTANDAVFNAYVAEMTTREYRGKIEGSFFVPFVGDVARFRDP